MGHEQNSRLVQTVELGVPQFFSRSTHFHGAELGLIETITIRLDDRSPIVRVLFDNGQPFLLWLANRCSLYTAIPLAPMCREYMDR